MAGPQPRRGFGMSADHDAAAGMFVTRGLQHPQKQSAVRAAQGCVAPRLVDDQDISRAAAAVRRDHEDYTSTDPPRAAGPAGEPRGRAWWMPAVVRSGVPGGRAGQDRNAALGSMISPTGPRAASVPAPGRQGDRSQECVLDRDQRAAVASRNGPTAPCRRGVAPDAHRIARPGQGQDRTVAGQRQDACDPGAGQETKVENAKPPGFPGG